MPVSPDTRIDPTAKIFHLELVNLYGCSIGPESRVGAFVEIQRNAIIGARCKISSHSFICEGVELDDEVFIGHGVMFTNDKFPRATNTEGSLQTTGDWSLEKTRVGFRSSIGSASVILPGITIGQNVLIGAGSVVTKDIPDYAIMAGNPARIVGDTRKRKDLAS